MLMELKTVEKLISLIRDRPPIYGPRPKRGKKKHQRILDELWKEVAVQLNRSVRECKLKWTTLRNCYARLLREERLHKVKKRHWHLRNQMSFLRGHIQPYAETRGLSKKRIALTRSKIPIDSSSQTNYSLDENTFPSIGDEPIETSTNSKNIHESPPVQDFVIVEHNTEQSCISWEQHREQQLPLPLEDNDTINCCQQFPLTSEENGTINCCPVINYNPFSSVEDSSQSKNIEEQSEANSLFLRSLLPDINKLSDRKQRIFKRKTLEVLEFLFDEGEFDVHRDDSHHNIRQCQITRSNYNVHQRHQAAMVSEKFVQKVEPTTSP